MASYQIKHEYSAGGYTFLKVHITDVPADQIENYIHGMIQKPGYVLLSGDKESEEVYVLKFEKLKTLGSL